MSRKITPNPNATINKIKAGFKSPLPQSSIDAKRLVIVMVKPAIPRKSIFFEARGFWAWPQCLFGGSREVGSKAIQKMPQRRAVGAWTRKDLGIALLVISGPAFIMFNSHHLQPTASAMNAPRGPPSARPETLTVLTKLRARATWLGGTLSSEGS